MKNLNLLKKLCVANGISGDEGSIREIIIDEIKDYISEYKIDNLGNIIAFKKGKNRAVKKLMISAHMDEVGFIVTDITSDGLIKFDEVGGIDRRVLPGRSVLIGGRVWGVIGTKPIHLCSNDEREKIPEYDSMYIDIGANSKEDAEKIVSLGDSITFESFYENNGYTIKSKAIDDRAGCFLMIEMIKSELEYDTYFTFVVQEEVGLHGAKVASYTVNPDFAIVLEATTAADIPEISTSKQVCNVNGGAVIGYMDKRTIYDKGMINHAKYLAEEHNIKLQFKRAVAGGNDAGVIHESRVGVRTLAISLPCRYLHSQLSLISKSDLEDTYNLACLLSSDISGGKI
ncbi:MAG: M42 family metallopeptidase [Ruminococcus sp.]|nr:M42 family metallopeptidase [Ruminococcus sp.]